MLHRKGTGLPGTDGPLPVTRYALTLTYTTFAVIAKPVLSLLGYAQSVDDRCARGKARIKVTLCA